MFWMRVFLLACETRIGTVLHLRTVVSRKGCSFAQTVLSLECAK